MFKIKRIIATALLASVFSSGSAVADWSDKTRAFTIRSSSPESLCLEDFQQTVRNLKSIGANTLSIAVAYWQESLTSSNIESYRRTTTDEALACGIRYVQSLGMDFGINMMINTSGWRANTDPDDRDEWFRQMGELATKYSRDFAQVYGAKHFSVGTEMFKLVSNDYDEENAAAPGRYRWPEIIQDVKANYTGTVTYSAQHSGDRSAVFDDNDLISNLDVIGLSAYFPLYASDDEGLQNEWARVERENILPIIDLYGKRLVISELGYRPCSFTFLRPYDSQTVCDYDGEIQAQAWNAMLGFFADKTYLDGMIGGWIWSNDPDKGGSSDTDYTPWNKPAANTFRAYWPIIDGTPLLGSSYVFSRSDTDEYRWVSGSENVWISESCAISLGGASQFGTWSDLNSLAPNFDQAADPCVAGTGSGSTDPVSTPTSSSDGYVFSRSDTTEFRWVDGSQNVWITESCAASLGGATQTGTWSDLNAVAPGFDQASDPCTSSPTTGSTSPVSADGYVFSRSDTTEFRWVSGSNNIWISSECASSLGGASETGTWSDLNSLAPGFDQASDPCSGASPGNGGETSATGFVFARSDKDEFRWVSGTQNVWITDSCAASLGGATQTGDWSDLNVIAPEFDAASDPCSTAASTPSTGDTADGYVFERTDTTEFRWVVGSNNTWISESCAASLGGTAIAGTWSDLNAVAPGFDSATSPCD